MEKSNIIGSFFAGLPPLTIALLIIDAVLISLVVVFFAKMRSKANENRSVKDDNISDGNVPSPAMRFETVVIQNQGKREYQQDSLYISDSNNESLVSEKGVLAVVADGMGGLQDGEIISKIVADTFKNRFNGSPIKDPMKFMTDSVFKAESDVDNHIYSSSMKGGSTVVSTLIKGGKLYFVSVGDSSIFLVRNNKVKRINKHHNYASVLQSKVRQGMITQQEADRDPMRSRITSFIGMGEVNELDTSEKPINLIPDDIIILCSDGVANALGNDALLDLINAGAFSEVGSRIEENILNQNIKNQDNFSAVLIKCL